MPHLAGPLQLYFCASWWWIGLLVDPVGYTRGLSTLSASVGPVGVPVGVLPSGLLGFNQQRGLTPDGCCCKCYRRKTDTRPSRLLGFHCKRGPVSIVCRVELFQACRFQNSTVPRSVSVDPFRSGLLRSFRSGLVGLVAMADCRLAF